MSYEVKGDILGFKDTKKVKINEVDELFSTMLDSNNESISFTLVNPYFLREYSFDISPEVRDLLEIKETSNLSAYNMVVIQEPLEESTVNFLAPVIINNDNNKIAQVILDKNRHPDFGMAESIASFNK